MPEFEMITPRLLLREIREEDAPAMFELNSDPEVIKFTGDEPFESIDEAAAFIRNYDQYDKNGFGRWAVVLRENEEILGWCGIRKYESDGMTDLGYRLHRRHWGKGFATEAAHASLEAAFNQFGLDFIIGRSMKENTASIRVLEKLGMRFWMEGDCHEHPALIYRIDAMEWRNK